MIHFDILKSPYFYLKLKFLEFLACVTVILSYLIFETIQNFLFNSNWRIIKDNIDQCNDAFVLDENLVQNFEKKSAIQISSFAFEFEISNVKFEKL